VGLAGVGLAGVTSAGVASVAGRLGSDMEAPLIVSA
jgi:hypothetical protein